MWWFSWVLWMLVRHLHAEGLCRVPGSELAPIVRVSDGVGGRFWTGQGS